MKSLICIAAAALWMAAPVWAHNDKTGTEPKATVTNKVDAHTQEDIERHRGMARAHEQAAQCLAEGQSFDICQKQLQASCKGLALGKNCGMRHGH